MVLRFHISAQAIKRCHLSFNFSQKVSSLKAFKNVNCICLRKRWFTSSLDELLLHTPYDTQQIILNLCRKRNYKFYIVANIKKPPLVFLLSFFLMRFEFFSVWSFSLGWWFCVLQTTKPTSCKQVHSIILDMYPYRTESFFKIRLALHKDREINVFTHAWSVLNAHVNSIRNSNTISVYHEMTSKHLFTIPDISVNRKCLNEAHN